MIRDLVVTAGVVLAVSLLFSAAVCGLVFCEVVERGES